MACIVSNGALGIRESYHLRDFDPERDPNGYFTVAPYMKARLSRGSVALEICRDSREVALKPTGLHLLALIGCMETSGLRSSGRGEGLGRRESGLILRVMCCLYGMQMTGSIRPRLEVAA